MHWVMAATLVCCTSVLTSCSSNDDNPAGSDSLAGKVVGKWIHADTDGEVATTDMKSVYTFTKDGSALKGRYSMSMTESGVWAYNQETDVTISGNTITMTSHLDDGQSSVVELTNVSVSGDDLRFTAKTTLSKNGQVTATYGPRQEHFTKVDADYTEAVVGLWEITFTSDNPEYESSEPYRELYRSDGTASFYDLINGQWVEEETTYSEYFADGPLFCFRWQKPGQEGRHENWEIISCTGDEMVNRAFHRRADGSTYTIIAHLKKVEWGVTPSHSRVGYSAWNTQVSYTHCDPLPKSGMPEFVSGTWEVNDGILQHKAYEQAPLAICNYVIPSDHYTIQCTACKDDGPEGFIIVFNYVDAQHYCWLNFGCGGNTQHAIEQISGDSRMQTAVRPGSVETGKWYDVKLTVAGDTVKAWLDDTLMFDEVLNTSLIGLISRTE